MILLHDLLATPGSRLDGPAAAHEFADICYDSRLAEPGQLFVAIKTEYRDGHAFIVDALRGGCTGVLCERPPVDSVGATVIVTPDVRLALQQWASAILARYRPTVIGVTGSVGKTSTKRAIATLLGGLGPTFASRRSFNSLFGLPIALGRLEPQHRFAVLEMGVDRFGEMERLAALFPPQIAVVTAVAPTHLRYLRDEAHIAAEKAELVRALPPDGLAILNADNPYVAAMAAQTRAEVRRYGLTAPDLALSARDIRPGLDGVRFTALIRDPQRGPVPVAIEAFIPLLGRHSVYTALAALAVALRCGMAAQEAVARLGLIERQAGRLNPLPGVNGCVVLDDTYNASPASLHAALDTLAALRPAGRRIAVLGDMLELGEAAEQLHRAAGAQALATVDLLVTKGDLAAEMVTASARERAAAPQRTAESIVTHTAADAIAAVRARVRPGDLVLVKGSAEARMEQIVAGLLAPQIDPTAALARQERAFATVRIATPDRPTWLEIDLEAIAGNAQRIKALVGPQVMVMATLKADAYGHGAIRVARTVAQHGVGGCSVATLGEAIALRQAGVELPILILGYTPPWQVRDAIRRAVRLTIFDLELAHEVSAAAQELETPAIVHVKVDTGMARLGLAPDETLAFLQEVSALPGVHVEGLFTHFATADSADERFAREQLRRFGALLASIQATGLRPPLVHAANSAAILRFREAHFDLVRPGLMLYGLAPSPETPLPAGIRPALSFKTAIAQIKTQPPGTPISYGGAFVTARESRIATIPVGYADGFRRSPSWRAVLVRGQRAPVVGRVAMDYAMIDVTDIAGARAGDEVVLIGAQGADRITADEVAAWLGTINYEVVAAILPRVPRVV
jgi:alanine racemase